MKTIQRYPPALWRIGWRYLTRHAWQSALMVLGITLGVAVVIAIDLANASASRAFELSTESVAGRATHEITARPGGIDQQVYAQLRRLPDAPAIAPVMLETVASPQLGNLPLQLLGVDPFAEPPFRSYLGGTGAPASTDLTAFLNRPGAVLISRGLAERYGLGLGDLLTFTIGGRSVDAFIAGLLEPADTLARRALDGLVLADIATAQEMTGRLAVIDRIDLIIPNGDSAAIERIKQLLPAAARLSPLAERSGNIDQLTAAFRVNLTALSLLALVVGLFLIYNTMTFSVVQRRPLFGMLRCLGVSRREVFTLVMVEALAVGAIGSALGVGLGILMGQTTVDMILQTINDLYFTTTVREVGLPLSSLIKGVLAGVLATAFTAAMPAIEAAGVPPNAALSRSGLESKARASLKLVTAGGALMILLGLGLFLLPLTDLISGFAGTLAVVVGFAAFAALALVALMRLVTPLTGRLFGLLGRMAPRNLVGALSRTAVAVASLMIAVSVTVGVSLMISSFRYTVQVWLSQTLQSDVYISVPDFNATTATAGIDPQVLQALSGLDGARRIDILRSVTVDAPGGDSVQVAATDNFDLGSERIFISQDVPDAQIWPRLQAGGVILSEPLANRLSIPAHGGSITLIADGQAHTFPVVGIHYDYASNQGTATMALDVYRRLWQDDTITAVGVRLQPGASADEVVRTLQARFAGRQQLLIRPNAALRAEVMEVFDRTFAITGALQLLATVVAFIGVLSALLLLQLEKQREVGILRAIGLTARQLWGLVMLETGLMGTVAGLLAMPTGYALALILIYVINRRSFGWTLQLAATPEPFFQALLVAVGAALLAGIYPAYRLGKMPAAEAIRYE